MTRWKRYSFDRACGCDDKKNPEEKKIRRSLAEDIDKLRRKHRN
jgi:hypothetical protein